MKLSYIKMAASALLLSQLITSCSLKEKNYSTVSLDYSFENKTAYEGLINSCYSDLYFLHGKVDFIAPNEGGTDLWVNTGNTGVGYVLYDHRLNTAEGNAKVVWGSAYSIVNMCNTAILYSKTVKGFETQNALNATVAQAYFLRAYANFILVEQFGDVVLRTTSSALDGVDNAPKRSSEKEFYDLIIADLKFAVENLPVTQTLRGRATKKAALGFLAKVYLQRTRLGDKDAYAKLALETAEELINNPGKYNANLYQSDNNKSGYSKLWAGENNKNNSEFLFVQAVDHTAGLNPEFWNRGRTRQYYLPDLGGRGAEWGAREGSQLYGRSNSRMLKPSWFLLTQVFEPKETTADTRFSETFNTKYYAASNKTITAGLATLYKKDPSIVGHTIKNTIAKAPKVFNYYELSIEEQANMNGTEGLAVFTPNWTIATSVKEKMPMLVVDPSDLFDPATKNYKDPAAFPNDINLGNVYPAMKKFSASLYCQSNQYWMGDIPIIRLGEVYLIAAEAAALSNNSAKAAEFVNVIRKRAALKNRENEMTVNPADVNIDYLVKESARELTGEHTRWIDLKRMGKLTKEYLQSTNPLVSTNFDASKHTKRPIPQSFLDAISNAQEFGTNGY